MGFPEGKSRLEADLSRRFLCFLLSNGQRIHHLACMRADSAVRQLSGFYSCLKSNE
jgi:hypothetical protein